MSGGRPLLSIRDLTVTFATDGGILRATDHVSFDVPEGRTVALVGESGCGKSVTAQAILRLIPTPPGAIESGEIIFDGRDLLALSDREMHAVRGARIAMVFQEPMTSLNPVYTVGTQIIEAIRLHRSVSRSAAKKRAIELLRKVGIPQPEERIDSYPHELSGGMRQRVMIAMGISCDPALLIADEPTTAVDMMTQAQILNLLKDLRSELSMSVLLIAHDFGVVAELADTVVVLYAGVVVERGPVRAVLQSPSHPYTRALLESVPPTGPRAFRAQRDKDRRPLPTIPGALPDMRSPPGGCRFQDRCAHAWDRCRREEPPLFAVEHAAHDAEDRARTLVRCFLADPVSMRGGEPPHAREAREAREARRRGGIV